MRNFLLSYGLIVVSALADSYAAFIVKTQFNKQGEIDLKSFSGFWHYIVNFIKSPLLLTAVIAFVLAPTLWFLALNKLELSIGYPVLVAFHLLFIMIFGMFFLGEPVTWNKIVSTILIFASVIILYQK